MKLHSASHFMVIILQQPLDHKYPIAGGVSMFNRKLDKHYDLLTFMPALGLLMSFCIERASGAVTLSCSSTDVDLEIVRTKMSRQIIKQPDGNMRSLAQ